MGVLHCSQLPAHRTTVTLASPSYSAVPSATPSSHARARLSPSSYSCGFVVSSVLRNSAAPHSPPLLPLSPDFFPSLRAPPLAPPLPRAPRNFVPVPALPLPPRPSLVSASSRCIPVISASATSSDRASPYFLQQAFGSPFIQFSGAAGIRTVELSTSDETTCRVLIDGARVTSYRAMMWHGAAEEVLYAASNDDDVVIADVDSTSDASDSTSPCNLIRGGVVVSFPASGALTAGSGRRVPLGELAARGEWEVTSASSASNGSWAKVVLSQSLTQESLPSSSWSGTASLSLTITLTPNSLSSSLAVQNTATRGSTSTTASNSSSNSSSSSRTEQPSSDLLFAPSLAAHLSLSTINGARLIGCKGVRYCSSGSGRQQRLQQERGGAGGGGLWGMGSLFGQLGSKKQSSGRAEESAGSQEGKGRVAATAAAATVAAAVTSAAAAEAGSGAGPVDKEMVGRLRGLWRDVVEGGEEGVERADYADIEAPLKRIFLDGPDSVTLLDRGRRLSFRLSSVGLGDLTVHAADETCGLPDWDEFLCIGFSRARHPLTLAAGQSWTGTFTLTNLGAP
ncbi:hypothetical protein CLOM_g9381 [Closterium sp. NIES-68]|nr:hypothetical protein CLOM_g9381 [Closterium sp. NIES-68]GJP63942.1 hypothetical protein CLOP_g20970 [Closterium sp. NIES-67]